MKHDRFHRQAEAEFAEAAQHYAEKSSALGVRFYITIMELIHEVRESPQRYRVIQSPCRRHWRENDATRRDIDVAQSEAHVTHECGEQHLE